MKINKHSSETSMSWASHLSETKNWKSNLEIKTRGKIFGNVFIKVTRSPWTFNPLSSNPTKWSTPCNNSSVDADELFDCVR